MKMKLDKKALLRKAKANQAATTSAKKGGSRIMIVSISVLVLLFAALPTTTLLAVGMTPTLVALVVDITPGRYLTRCVAGLNVTGTVPFIGTLWSGVNDISSAIRHRQRSIRMALDVRRRGDRLAALSGVARGGDGAPHAQRQAAG